MLIVAIARVVWGQLMLLHSLLCKPGMCYAGCDAGNEMCDRCFSIALGICVWHFVWLVA